MQCEPRLNGFVAGFPCQPFSQQNVQRFSKDPWSNEKTKPFRDIIKCRGRGMRFHMRVLSLWYLRSERSPDFCILENVYGAMCGGKTMVAPFEAIAAELDGCEKYWWRSVLLQAQDFGLPQRRRRLYIIVVSRAMLASPGELDKIVGDIKGCAFERKASLDQILLEDNHAFVVQAQEHWEGNPPRRMRETTKAAHRDIRDRLTPHCGIATFTFSRQGLDFSTQTVRGPS